MKNRKNYFLICHIHLFYLYQKDEKVTLLGTQRHLEPLFDLMASRTIKKVTILDHTAFQQIKVESAANPLSFPHVIQWYVQKKKYINQCFSNTFTHFYLGSKSLLTATLEQNPILSQITKELKTKNIRFCIASYPLALTSAFYTFIAKEFHECQCCLLILIDRFSNAILSCFHNKRLVFIRKFAPAPQDSVIQQFKNMILDTLKFLEKRILCEKISLFFFIEGTFDSSSLISFFPYGTFFVKEDLILFLKKHTQIPGDLPFDTCFDLLVLSKKSRPYLLKAHEKIDGHSLIKKLSLSPYKKIVLGGVLLVNIYLIYAMCRLGSEVHACASYLKMAEKKLAQMSSKIAAFPLRIDEVKFAQDIQKKSLLQERQLIDFLDLLAHCLDHQYILKSLSIGGQKTKFSLEPIEKNESFDHFLELWHQSCTDSHIYNTPDHSLPVLGIETTSPLVHEKIF